ncbi:outer membrane beta-barrel protein [Gemmatimonas sp.]|uniref:outer membrane beta-barrel protein n=1 Tax=Gemmatimonas sp. TaxID=1962908 RepID=UPI00391B3345
MKRTLHALGSVVGRMAALAALAAFAAFAAPAALSAQVTTTEKPVTFGISGGVSLPTGDYTAGLQTGYALAGHLYITPATFASLRFRGDVTFDNWNFEGPNNGSFRSLGVVGNVLYDFPAAGTSATRPYLLAGLGGFDSKESVGGQSTTHLGFQIGGGLAFQLSGFTTFAEAKFVNVFTDGASLRYLPLTFGVRF